MCEEVVQAKEAVATKMMLEPLAETDALEYGSPDLYYRHARGENLLLVGPERNRFKNPWLRRQVDMFDRLGWRFIVVDMTATGEMGPAHLLGEPWSAIERHALVNIRRPVIAASTFQNLLTTLDQILQMKQQWHLQHGVIIHLGDLRSLSGDERLALKSHVIRFSLMQHGLWLVAEHLQALFMDVINRNFHTQVVLPDTLQDGDMATWRHTMGVDRLQLDLLDEGQACFILRGRSEGARGKLLVGPLDSYDVP